MRALHREHLRAEFEVPMPVAVWLVVTHVLVLASPLALIWAVDIYTALLPEPLANATLVKLACAVYIGATAFEVAQNSADRWYLTQATRSVADLFFNAFMTAAFCMYTIGFHANTWMTAAALLLTFVYPVAYINNHSAQRAISGVVVVLATLSVYFATHDPVVWLFMAGNGLAVYLLVFLFRSGSQWLHGWAALVFALAFLAWPWAIISAAKGTPASWWFVAAVTAAVALGAAALAPVLAKTRATERRRPGPPPGSRSSPAPRGEPPAG